MDATGDGGPALAATQALGREVDGCQRGGACRVDGEAGAGEVEDVGHPVGDRPEGGAAEPRPAARRLLGRKPAIIRAHHADENADLAVPGLGQAPGILEPGPHRLEEQPLLRVHRRGLGRRDAEQQRIEARDVRQEPTPPERCLLGPQRAERGPVGGRIGDGRATRLEIVPERLDRLGTGIAPGDPDDGDRIVMHRRERVRAPAPTPELEAAGR